jgi:cellulose biosynthesis protein BcsQ
MAFVITVLLRKGGVGKTTTAVALAEAAALASAPTVLVDSDPMGAAARWAELAEAQGRPLNSQVMRIPAVDIPARIGTGRGRDAGIIVIDAPPPGPGSERIAGAAVSVADRVVMPVSPALANLDRIDSTRSIAVQHGKPFRAVLTMVNGHTPGSRDLALEALASWGVPVYSSALPLTVAVERNYGQPVSGPLLRFGIDLLGEILKEANDARAAQHAAAGTERN